MARLPLTSDPIPAGTYRPGAYPGKMYGYAVQPAEEGTVFVQGYTSKRDDNLFRLNDGIEKLTIRGIDFSRLWRVWVTAAEDMTFQSCHFHHIREEGLLAGVCKRLIVNNCISEYIGKKYGPPLPDASDHPEASADHAFYFGSGSESCLLSNSTARYATGCAFHSNWYDETGKLASKIGIDSCQFLYCGSEGTGAVQVDGTTDSYILNTLIAMGNAGIYFGDDGRGPRVACKRWDIRRLTLIATGDRWNIHLANGCEKIAFSDSIIVMRDDPEVPLYSAPDGRPGRYEDPTLRGCVIFAPVPGKLPQAVRSNNDVRQLSGLPGFFKPSSFVPADPGVSQGWRPAAAPAVAGLTH